MINKISSVTITQVANGFLVDVTRDGAWPMEIFVANSVKDSYSYGSVSLTKVLDDLFNPPVVPENEATVTE